MSAPLAPGEPLGELDQILARRAQAGALMAEIDAPTRKLVVFALADEWFGLDGASVREILPMRPIFFVPGCPPSLEGVINVRGDIESVISLFTLLEKAPGPDGAEESILLGRGAGMLSGVRVGRVVDVIDIADSQIQPAPATLPETMRRFVSGLTLLGAVPVAILDLNRVFEAYRRGAP